MAGLTRFHENVQVNLLQYFQVDMSRTVSTMKQEHDKYEIVEKNT